MRNLKILIWFLENNVEYIMRTFNALHYRYGVETLTIEGVIGEGKFTFGESELKNVTFENVSETTFDYVIATGLAHEIPNYTTLKKALAEKIKMPSESIVFDFEIYDEKFSLPKVCLVVMFNHRFDKNLPLLRKIYGERFSDIRFLMPFYDGSDSDVIPVYESSYQFQGYFIQAYEKLKDISCSHYLFIGDDLIINPAFDEINFTGRTNMYNKKFMCRVFPPLNSPNKFRWYWTIGSSKPFYDVSTTWRDSIYSYDEALSKFNDFFGEKYKEIYDEDFFGNPNEPGNTMFGYWNNAEGFRNMVNYFIMTNGNSLRIPYPMAGRGGGADIFCIEKVNLFEFSRLCGIFSAMNMFVEIATSTATVLTYKRDDVKFFPKESEMMLWGNDRIAFENKYERNFNRLYDQWAEKLFFVHPVKLSRWKVM